MGADVVAPRLRLTFDLLYHRIRRFIGGRRPGAGDIVLRLEWKASTVASEPAPRCAAPSAARRCARPKAHAARCRCAAPSAAARHPSAVRNLKDLTL